MNLGSSLVFAFLFSAAVVHAGNYRHSESFSQTHEFDPAGELLIENVNGSIDIRTWDRNEILVEGEKRGKTAAELELIELDLDLTASRADLRARLPKRSGGGWFSGNQVRGAVNFRVTVPENAVLRKIKTVNGAVSIEGARGSVDADSVNGRITATGLRSDARIHTVNGALRVSFADVPAETQLELRTVNGGIEVELPEDAGVIVDGSVVNGGISSDLPMTVKGRMDRRHLNGTIGDGRASLSLRTVNGGIKLTAAGRGAGG